MHLHQSLVLLLLTVVVHKRESLVWPGRSASDPSKSSRVQAEVSPISKCTQRLDLGEALLDGDRDLFRVRRAGKRGPGDVGISDVLVVLLGLVAVSEEPRLGMMNRWRRQNVLKAKVILLRGVADRLDI